MLFEQYETDGTVNPAKIISTFHEEEDQTEVAALFNATIHQVENRNDMEKAIKETILRIKKNSINYRTKHMDPSDLNGLMKVVEDKRNLEKLEKLNISLN